MAKNICSLPSSTPSRWGGTHFCNVDVEVAYQIILNRFFLVLVASGKRLRPWRSDAMSNGSSVVAWVASYRDNRRVAVGYVY